MERQEREAMTECTRISYAQIIKRIEDLEQRIGAASPSSDNANAARSCAAVDAAPSLTVAHGGTISGILPCGHATKWIDVDRHDGDADVYCSMCFNAPEPGECAPSPAASAADCLHRSYRTVGGTTSCGECGAVLHQTSGHGVPAPPSSPVERPSGLRFKLPDNPVGWTWQLTPGDAREAAAYIDALESTSRALEAEAQEMDESLGEARARIKELQQRAESAELAAKNWEATAKAIDQTRADNAAARDALQQKLAECEKDEAAVVKSFCGLGIDHDSHFLNLHGVARDLKERIATLTAALAARPTREAYLVASAKLRAYESDLCPHASPCQCIECVAYLAKCDEIERVKANRAERGVTE
jgi:hypothetical protein